MLSNRPGRFRSVDGQPSRRNLYLVSIFLGLIAFALLITPPPLRAGKKKSDATPAPAPLDQPVTAYFDITKIVWPSPPEIPRVAFKDIYTGEKIDPNLFIKQKHKQTWMDRLAGAQPDDRVRVDKLPFQLIRTYGVGVDSKGKIYAADQGVGAVFIFDPENRQNVEMIGNGRQANLQMISGLTLDDDDRLFLVDTSLRRVLVFSPKHEVIATFGPDVLVRPGGVAIDRENRFVYVADAGNDCVDVFDADNYKFLRRLGKPSRKHEQTDPGTFSLPEGVAVDKDGNVFVADTFNDRIETFNADGEFISTFGKNGDGPADFERPKSIAVDCDGHLWVVDAAQNMVKVFNQQGRLLIYFGGEGYYPGQFNGPWGIAIGPQNQVVVSETFPGRVQVFHYVNDAEAAALRAQRDAAGQKPSGTPASSGHDAGPAKPVGAPATGPTGSAAATPPGDTQPAALKDSAAN